MHMMACQVLVLRLKHQRCYSSDDDDDDNNDDVDEVDEVATGVDWGVLEDEGTLTNIPPSV